MNVIEHLLVAAWFVYFTSFSSETPFDYCKFNCVADGVQQKNVLCGNKCQPASNTLEQIAPDFTFRTRMLHYHNYYRDMLASGKNTSGGNGESSNMMAISYDMNLEFTVACWLYKAGKMEHDKCRGSRSFQKVGQNLYQSNRKDPRTDAGAKRSIEAWYNELVFFETDWIDKFPNSVTRRKKYPDNDTGHFSQLVWATSTHIGCAASYYQGPEHKMYLVGCNYGPRGNIVGRQIYKKGKATSECPNGTKANSEFPSLCGNIIMPPEAKITGMAELAEVRGKSNKGKGRLLTIFVSIGSLIIFM